MNKKSESAGFEFLYAYGWAILVVLIAIGSLVYFGVLTPEKLNIYKYNESNIAESCSNQSVNYLKYICVAQAYDDSNLINMTKPCNVASNFYCNTFNKMDGFNCKKVILNGINHALSIVTFNNQYCIMDMQYRKCIYLGDDE